MEISIGSKAVIVAVGDRVGGGFSKVGIPAIRGSRAFVEWASFDCDPARRDELTGDAARLVREMARIAAKVAGQLALRVPAGRRDNAGLAPIYVRFRAHFGTLPSISGYPADSGPRTDCCIRGPHLA